MKLQMSEGKETADSPTVIIKATEMENPPRPRNTKKIVVGVVAGIVVVAIILIAILVGMYFFTETQKEILKYSLQLNKNTKQDVTSDPNTNIVQYHLNTGNYEAWIYNDFNRDIQVVKFKTDSKTVCYSSPLNRTTVEDPKSMTVPSDADPTNRKNTTLYYDISDFAIPDTSFLSKTVRDACQGISTYWTYPSCKGAVQRRKRAWYCYDYTYCACCWSCYDVYYRCG